MKKVLCLLVVLLFVGSFAMTESFDWSSYTNEQLTTIRDLINEELERRELNEGKIPSWFDYGMGVYAPDPNVLFGRKVSYENNVFGNRETMLVAIIDDCSKEEFSKYVDAIIKYGFTDVIERSNAWYQAKNTEGIEARIVYTGNLSIDITKR